MNWQKNKKDSLVNQKYYIVNGNKNICKVKLSSGWRCELWHRQNGIREFIATGNLDELKQIAREM
ncbi:MAG TPA: hypothetical protein VIC51_15395 [Psychromonas sp.]